MPGYLANLLGPGSERGKKALNEQIACWKVGSRMDRVLLGERLPESFSLLDKGIPPRGSGNIDCGVTSLVRDVWS